MVPTCDPPCAGSFSSKRSRRTAKRRHHTPSPHHHHPSSATASRASDFIIAVDPELRLYLSHNSTLFLSTFSDVTHRTNLLLLSQSSAFRSVLSSSHPPPTTPTSHRPSMSEIIQDLHGDHHLQHLQPIQHVLDPFNTFYTEMEYTLMASRARHPLLFDRTMGRWHLSPFADSSPLSVSVGPCPWQCSEPLPRVRWVRSGTQLGRTPPSNNYDWTSSSHYLGATYTDRPWYIPPPGTDTRWNCFLYLGDDNPNGFLCGSLQHPGPCFIPAPRISSYLQILHLIVLYTSSLPHTVSESYRCAFRLRLLRENLYHHYGHGSTALLGAPALIGAPGYSSHRLGLSYALRDRRGGSSSHASDRLQRFPYPFRFHFFPHRNPMGTPP